MRFRTLSLITVLGGLLCATPSTAFAQPTADTADSPWFPWLGCWQLVADVVKLPAVLKGPGEKEYRIPDEQLVVRHPRRGRRSKT